LKQTSFFLQHYSADMKLLRIIISNSQVGYFLWGSLF